jgi:hypothetical protein
VQLYSDCRDTFEKLRAHAEKKKIKYAVGLDPGGETLKKYLRSARFPAAYLVGKDGKGAWEGVPSSKEDRLRETEALIETELAK